MGSSTSKAARTAAGAARRQYPQRVPSPPSSNASSAPRPPAGQPTAPGPTVYPQSQASNTRDECEFLFLSSLLHIFLLTIISHQCRCLRSRFRTISAFPRPSPAKLNSLELINLQSFFISTITRPQKLSEPVTSPNVSGSKQESCTDGADGARASAAAGRG